MTTEKLRFDVRIKFRPLYVPCQRFPMKLITGRRKIFIKINIKQVSGYGNNHLSATHISHSMISEVLYLYIQGIGSPAAICAILTMTCFRTVIDITFLVNTKLLDIIFDGYPFNCNFLLASVI